MKIHSPLLIAALVLSGPRPASASEPLLSVFRPDADSPAGPARVDFALRPEGLVFEAGSLGLEGRDGRYQQGQTTVPMKSADKEKVSVVKAGLYSLVLPGLGQRYLGAKTRSTVFFIAEGAIWTTFAVFLVQESNRREEYREYAAVFAGVTGDRDDEYYKQVGRFLSNEGVGGYNEWVRREARSKYFPDIVAMNEFYDRFAITGTDGWLWESEARFITYREIRESANQSERFALYTLAAAAVNRVVSVIDAVRLGRSVNKQIDQENAARLSMHIDFDPGTRPEEATFSVSFSRLF